MGCGGSRVYLFRALSLEGCPEQDNLKLPGPIPSTAVLQSVLSPVSLEFLITFAEQCDGEITTAQVVDSIVKPQTKAARCRYIDLPHMQQHKMPPGGTFYFVSHSWSNPFRDMVDAVHGYLINAVASEVYCYVDIFIVTQHEGVDQEDDLTHLQSAVKHAAQTLVCMDRAGIVMSRVWCLYEMWTTVTLKSKHALVLLSRGLSAEDRTAIFSRINVNKARASVPADKARILANIAGSPGGVEGLNATLKLLFLLDPIDAVDDLNQLLQHAQGHQRWNWDAADEWLAIKPGEQNYRAFSIYGDPGCGKSTIAAALARHLGVQGMHFCKASDATRNDPVNAIRSLAWQLAGVIPALKMIYAALPAHVIAAIGTNAEAAFEALLLRPLTQLFCSDVHIGNGTNGGPGGDELPEELFILMDAVDEAEPTSSTSADANAMLHLLCANFAALPECIRFLVTSRPLPHIQRFLSTTLEPLGVQPDELRPRAETLHMLQDRLSRCGFASQEAEQSAEALLERSAGSMVYPIIAFELMQNSREDISVELGVRDIMALPESLIELFHEYFGLLTHRTPMCARETVIELLQVLAAAQQPLSFRHLHALGFERISEDLLPHLGCLFFRRNFHVYGLHKTVYEWLASPSSPADMHMGHHKLGHAAASCVREASQSIPTRMLTHGDSLSHGDSMNHPRTLAALDSRRNHSAGEVGSVGTTPVSDGGASSPGPLTKENSQWSIRRRSPASPVMAAFANVRDYDLRYAVLHGCVSFHPQDGGVNPLKQPRELTGSLMRGMSHHFDHSTLWAPRRLSANEKSLTWLEELLLNFDLWEVLFTKRAFAAAAVADLVQWIPSYEVSPIAHDVMHWVLRNHADLMQAPELTLRRALEAPTNSAVHRAATIFYR